VGGYCYLERQLHESCSQHPKQSNVTELLLKAFYFCLPLDSMHTSFSRGSRHPLNSCIRLGIGARRYYAIQTPGAPTVNVFNNRAKWLQKERAASNVHLSRQADYLRDEVAFRLCERLLVWRFIALDRGAMLTMVRTSIATSIMFSTLAQTPATLRAS
jgi:hypothetical protein